MYPPCTSNRRKERFERFCALLESITCVFSEGTLVPNPTLTATIESLTQLRTPSENDLSIGSGLLCAANLQSGEVALRTGPDPERHAAGGIAQLEVIHDEAWLRGAMHI